MKRTCLDSSVLIQAVHVAAAKALKCDEFITAEKPGKPLHEARGLEVVFLPAV